MARTAAANALTALHQRQQKALCATALQELFKLFPVWTPGDTASYQALEDALVLLIGARGQQSAALAAKYYDLFRLAEMGTVDAFAAPLAEAVSEQATRTAIGATIRGGYTAAVRAGQTSESALRHTLVRTSGMLMRSITDRERYTVIRAVNSDKRAMGWARVTGGSPCAWCAMLASRGPVYKGDPNAIEIWDHDHGGCSAEPAFPGYEWNPKSAELRRAWNEHATGDDQLLSFRRHLEGRSAPE